MKNAAPYIRQQLFSTITTVPVFEEGEALNEEEYVVLGNQQFTADNDKKVLNDIVAQTIEVVVVNKSKKRLDEIGTAVMNSVSVPTNADFQIIAPEKSSQFYLTEKSTTGDIIRRLILIYNYIIVQR